MQVRLFNSLQVESDQPTKGLVLRPRAQRLLVYLLLHRKIPIPRKTLAFTLWPDTTETESLGTLRRAISDLRAALPDGKDWIVVTRDKISWNATTSFWLDVDEFEDQIQRADSKSLLSAVELYMGDLLRDMDEEWLLVERERYRQMQVDTLRKLTLHYQSLKDYPTALEFTRRTLLLEPLSEPVYQDRMRLYVLSGDRATALVEYEHLRSKLMKELGIAPMEETNALMEAIARGEALIGMESVFTSSSSFFQIPPKLVGRRNEIDKLIHIWENASRGHGSITIVSGEAGVGKSHLVRSLAYQVSQKGGLPLLGHCYEFESTIPHQPIVEALRPAVHLIRTLHLSSAHRSALARLLPEVFETNETMKLTLSPEELRVQLLEAVLQSFILLSQRQPVLLVIEDMHWATESVLDWLTFIAPRLRESHLLVVITHRTDEINPLHALPRLVRRFERDDILITLPLQRLTRDINREWVAHLSGLEIAKAFEIADRLFAETAGNPLFLQEIVRGLVETGKIKVEEGKWSGSFVQSVDQVDVPIPDSLREAILARTGRLSEMARTFLQAAASAGRTFRYDIVSGTGSWADEKSLNALEDLRARGFVREGNPPGTFVFTHHLIRDAIYTDMTTPRRIYWHLHLARKTEELFPDDYETIAYHFAAAGEKQLGIEYARKAAQRAEGHYAYEDAIRHLRVALDLLGSEDRSGMRLLLMEALADEYRFLRQGVEAIQTYQAALSLWRDQGPADKISFVRLHRKILQATASMWETTEKNQNLFATRTSQELHTGLDRLVQVIQEIGPHEESVRLLKELAIDSLIFHFPENKDGALQHAEYAVELAERLGAPVALASALATVVSVYGATGRLRERVEVALRALVLSNDPLFDNEHMRLQILIIAAKCQIDIGNYARAISFLEEAETIARRIHAVHEENQALSLLHQCWFRLDRWDDMQNTEERRRALQETYPLQRIGAPCFAIGLSSAVQALMGNLEKAHELKDESYAIMVRVTGPAENWKRSHRY